MKQCLALIDLDKLRIIGEQRIYESVQYPEPELSAYLHGFNEAIKVFKECAQGIKLNKEEQ